MPVNAKKGRRPAPTSREVISRQLRQVILDSGMSHHALARESGVSARVIDRFVAEQRDVKLETVDRLADVLGLRLVETGRGRARSPRARERPATDARGPRQTRREEPAMIDPGDARSGEERP